MLDKNGNWDMVTHNTGMTVHTPAGETPPHFEPQSGAMRA